MRNDAARYRAGQACPWGWIQGRTEVAEGIYWITTGGHGGFCISEDRYAEMPQGLRECSMTKDQWFEEDCSWCAVVLSWPQYFSPEMLKAAQDTFDRWYAGDTPAFMAGLPVELD